MDSQDEKNRPKSNDILRAFACFFDYMFFFDENTTVNGAVAIGDFGRYSLKTHAHVSLEDRRDFAQTWQV